MPVMNNDSKFNNSDTPECIVGIGASAGGLEALQQFLSFLPGNTGMGYVIIQHLSPEHKSLMAEILTKYTSMPVIQAENDMLVQTDTVYLIPPKYNMIITEGRLRLNEYNHDALNHPIDIFFYSLAESYENKSIAVIMSGTGSDGTNGIRAIKEQNGVILVQNPEGAKFDGMPRNAISTGFVDLVMTADEIAREMPHIAQNLAATDLSSHATNDDMLAQVYVILRKASNVNYTYYKQSTIMRRIERRMVIVHKSTMLEYVSYLAGNMEEAKILAKEVLIGVTSFFRDSEYFETLKDKTLRTILERSNDNDQIRIWSAGCSTGEEAYTIAILLTELMEEMKLKRSVKIFATDLDSDAVAFAGKGLFRENIINDIGMSRLSRFFTRKGSGYLINHEIRKKIVFAQHNVFQDPPFGRLDLISCRNMMIYFQSVLQQELFSIFHVALKDGGFLFLGKSEAVNKFNDIFLPYCNMEKIFVHNADGKTPLRRSITYSVPMYENPIMRKKEAKIVTDNGDYNMDDLYLKSLEAMLPASIIVNEKNELKHSFGDCREYIRLPVGIATLDIFSLVRDELKIAVSTALKASREQENKVIYDNIPFKVHGEVKCITLTVQPIRDKNGGMTKLFGLSFQDNVQAEPQTAVHYNIDAISSQRIADLEGELRESQENLQKTVSELESVNAELQAANEELLTANEELQSSNEELQSVNEELYTMNAEYQEKVSELGNLNDDMSNFLSTTFVGIMFVDKNMNIRKYTDYISSEFNICEQDIGRTIQLISYNFININLMELSKNVLNSMEPIEQNMVSVTGKTFMVRISPYRTEKNKIVGLVLTFVDTTKRQADQKQLEDMARALRSAVRKSEEKENFLSRMSHDMRTPMTSIIGLVELMLDAPEAQGELRENLVKTEQASHLLLSLINEVLETSKIDAGKIITRFSPIHEENIISNSLLVARELAKEKNVKFEYSFENCQNRLVMADSEHVSRIMLNLLSNAIKFTPEDGTVSLAVKAEYQANGMVHHTYYVRDTGCGISKGFQEKMYMPFEQENNDYLRPQDGTGLGLFICQQLLRLLGGTIKCQSTCGEGTLFTVTIDYGAATEEQITVLTAPNNNTLSSLEDKHILLCEDHPLNAEIIKKLLAKNGMLIDIMENGEKGLLKFIESEIGYYDIVLMDIRMPVMNGIEAAKKIRGLERRDAKTIPIIALTADAFEQQIEECIKAGMNGHLAKPIVQELLYSTINAAITKGCAY